MKWPEKHRRALTSVIQCEGNASDDRCKTATAVSHSNFAPLCVALTLHFDPRQDHSEHTILLSRKRVNKGMKRMNSLPLSPVVISYATLQGKPLPASPA